MDELVAAEIGGSAEPSEVEISTWYAENRTRVGRRTLDQLRPQIADLLRKQRRAEANEKFEERLNNSAKGDRPAGAVSPNAEQRRRTGDGSGERSGHPGRVLGLRLPFCGRFHRRSSNCPTSLETNCGSCTVSIPFRACIRTRSRPPKRPCARTTREILADARSSCSRSRAGSR